jgi:cytochrome P450
MSTTQPRTIAPGFISTLRTLRKLVRNPMEAWPPSVYTEPLVITHMLGRRTAFVMDPALVQQVLVEASDDFIKAEPMRRALEPALGQGILTAEGARWRAQRRLTSPVFRPAHVDGFLPTMIKAARDMRDRWTALPDNTGLEVTHEMMRVTFDIILETMLSGRGTIDATKVEASMRHFLESTSWAVALSALRAPLWMPFPGKRRAYGGGMYLRRMVGARVAERRRTGERREDLLSLMLDSRDPETGEGLGDPEIVDNVLTFVAAGHETTAIALTWTLYLLAHHPDIERKILDEIAAVTSGSPLEPAQLGALQYLRQVILESMRLFPPVAMVVRQPIRRIALGDRRLDAGDNVFLPIHAIHHHASLWPDPEKFDPERFAPEAVKARHRWAYLPFGGGPRICIGMGFALLEAAAILGTILPTLRLSVDPAFRPTPRLRVTMRPAQGMPMRVRRRQG